MARAQFNEKAMYDYAVKCPPCNTAKNASVGNNPQGVILVDEVLKNTIIQNTNNTTFANGIFLNTLKTPTSNAIDWAYDPASQVNGGFNELFDFKKMFNWLLHSSYINSINGTKHIFKFPDNVVFAIGTTNSPLSVMENNHSATNYDTHILGLRTTQNIQPFMMK